jgi:hypothetical protein
MASGLRWRSSSRQLHRVMVEADRLAALIEVRRERLTNRVGVLKDQSSYSVWEDAPASGVS